MIPAVLALAALTGPLPKLGVVAVGALAAVVLVVRAPRQRALAMVGALVLSPVLLLAEIWHSSALQVVHRHPLPAVIGAALVLVLLVASARLITPRFGLLGPLAVLALPFRIPIQAGGSARNLLVPLYLVVGVGALAWLGRVLGGGEPAGAGGTLGGGEPAGAGGAPTTAPGSRSWALWAERLLAMYVLLYGLQAVYSADFEQGLQNMVFFYVPFTLLYALLRSLAWTPSMVRRCLLVIVALAVIFAAIAYVEYATKTIILNPKLVVTNDLHTYFTVNSVFFDPDIFGRFLALVMILLAVVLLYPRAGREQALTVAVLAGLWVALVLTLSRSSLGALLVGMAVLAALRWKPSRALYIAVVVIAAGGLTVAASPRTFGLNQGVNGASSGRGGLISGGARLFADRPVWGYGSGSFVTEYRRHNRATATSLSASHTIPVTIAAEQGLVGELLYLGLVITALVCLVRRARGDPLRSALAAAFAALVFHTMLYADFLEDPVTWALLAVGISLAGTGGEDSGAVAATAAPSPRRSAARRVARPSWAIGLAALAALLLGGCGHAPSSTTARTPPLSATEAHRIASICHRSETPEDQDVVMALANQGGSILSPNVLTALKAASTDVAREAREVRAAFSPAPSAAIALANDMSAEAGVLNQTGHVVGQLATAEAPILSILHRRVSDARRAGVSSCVGVGTPSALRAKRPGS